jgi:uncharacterized iron-regulated membrane protein
MQNKPNGAPAGAGYEKRDADAGALLRFALGLFLVMVAVFVSMRWVFFHFAEVQQLGPAASPFEQARALPPQPRLQPDPKVDLQHVREGQQAALNSYGWVDRQNGTVHIPIELAMKLVLDGRLPVRPAAGGGTVTPKKESVRR